MDVYGWSAVCADRPGQLGFGWHGMGGSDWGGHTGCPGDPRKNRRQAILDMAVTPNSGGGAVEIVSTPSGQGYWVCGSDGGVFTYGDAEFHGSLGDTRLNEPIISMAASPTGHGYWLLGADGGVFTFGDAGFYGAPTGLVQ
jgi:hypothetical protein